MPARILIVDHDAAHRVVVKVKMLAAGFAVDACADIASATALMARRAPDLILLNFADPTAAADAFCRSLRAAQLTRALPVIALGLAETAAARFAALDAGADDVMPGPLNDALLLARIRSLLRLRSTGVELALRNSTSRALGFEERGKRFDPAARITLFSHDTEGARVLQGALGLGLRLAVGCLSLKEAAADVTTKAPAPDLCIIDASDPARTRGDIFGLLADPPITRTGQRAAQLVLVPPEMPHVAAICLDLGADDAIPANAGAEEITLRARRLIRHKQVQDRLRTSEIGAAAAAVTDPCSGLFDRRYADGHLAQLAQQAQRTGEGLAVMMVEIDQFSAITARHGQTGGTAVLKALGQRLRQHLRLIDLIARGGEAGCLIALPRTTAAETQSVAERLRHRVSAAPFAVAPAGQTIAITVSIGIALCPRDRVVQHNVSQEAAPQDPAEAACRAADHALLLAKGSGRDQVALARSAA